MFPYSDLDKLVLAAAQSEICGRFDCMNTVSAFDSFQQMLLPGILCCSVNQIDTGLIQRDRVCRCENHWSEIVSMNVV